MLSPFRSNFDFSKSSKTNMHPPKNDKIKALNINPNSFNQLLLSSPKNGKLKDPITPTITGIRPKRLKQ